MLRDIVNITRVSAAILDHCHSLVSGLECPLSPPTTVRASFATAGGDALPPCEFSEDFSATNAVEAFLFRRPPWAQPLVPLAHSQL
eukprot:scaffold244_cov416-Prasinococcus_capsulatus_cf.AAC.4